MTSVLELRVQASLRPRPDIQGIRAFAVIAVVLYHAGVPFTGGGFAGVDIFFVVSGFLITSNLVGEFKATRQIDWVGFARRRIARLAPVALVVIATTLLSAKFFVAPLLLPEIARDGLSSLFAVANLRLAATGTDYLASHSPSPFQHYWSLGLEEQFYLVWPALLLVILRVSRDRQWLVLASVAFLAVASFVSCLWLTGVDQPWSFFGLPTRAWELGVGAALAACGSRIRLPHRIGLVSSWIALATLGSCVALFSASTTWPGMATSIPVAATALLLVGGLGGHERGAPRILAIWPVAAIGDVSYSFYLWHWPFLVVPALVLGQTLSVWQALAAMVLALGTAFASYRFLERPSLKMLVRIPLRRTIWLAAVAAAFVAVLAVGVGTLPRLTGGRAVAEPTAAEVLRGLTAPQSVPANLTPRLEVVANDVPVIYADGCHADTAAVESAACLYGPAKKTGGAGNGGGGIVLFGDSHAAQWFSPLRGIAIERGVPLLDLTKSACPAVNVTVRNESLDRTYRECDEWRVAAFQRIAEFQPSTVVVSNAGAGYRDLTESSEAFDDAWSNGLTETVEAIPATSSVVVVGDTPRWPVSPNICLSAHLRDVSACSTSTTRVVDSTVNDLEKAVASNSGAAFVSPDDWLCSKECSPVLRNHLVYRDSNHLADATAVLLRPRLEEIVVEKNILH